ncbi:UNVERIFIED_CONTAM: Pentatricopeptide repeat-containing protein, mitochondrial [Sesamum radiatum]|uniref:Pentatricopeptide repeat-containing protein, mitochondrial n=1 Tax=Sesamum radiatum TaxID=300843 RepID=A0AAW2VZH4_SESRA
MAALTHFFRPRFAFAKMTFQLKLFHSFSDSEHDEPSGPPCGAVEKPSLPPFQHSPDADSLSQVLIRHHNPFHHMESSLQLYGISLSPPLVHQTLLRLKHHSKIALAFFEYIGPITTPLLLLFSIPQHTILSLISCAKFANLMSRGN